MSPPTPFRIASASLAAALAVLALAACGSAVSTSSFKGEPHAVAQAISNLQSDATGGEQKKICANDLAASVVKGLGGQKACEQAIKKQLAEIESLDLTITSIKLDASAKTATASVKSTYAGKKRQGTVTLVKEGGRWKVSGI
jgi:hypothetical protein